MPSKFQEVHKHDTGKEFSHDAQERDTSVVVIVAPVTLILVALDEIWRNAIGTRCFAAKLSITMWSLARVGSASNSYIMSRCSVASRAEAATVFSGVEL